MTWLPRNSPYRFTLLYCFLFAVESVAGDPQTEKTVPFSLSGTAKDNSGKPIAGATINLCMGPNQNSKVSATTKSGVDGRYEFKEARLKVSPAIGSREKLLVGGFSLFGRAQDYGFGWSGSRYYWDKERPKDGIPQQGHIDFYRGEPLAVDLEFTRATSLKGRVIDEDSRPIVGAKVWLWHADYLNGDGKALHINEREFSGIRQLLTPEEREAKTDSDGRFEIGGLPSEVCFGVAIDHPGYGNASFHAATTARPITIHRFNQSGTAIRNGVQIEVALPDSHEVRTGEITVQLHPLHSVLIDVIEDDTGKPAANVKIETNGLAGNGPSAFGKTDRNGRVVLEVPIGHYRLTADPPRDSLYVRTRANLDGVTGRDKEPLTMRLIKGCVVNFVAVDADSGEGIAGIGFQADDLIKLLNQRRSGLIDTTTTYADNPRTDKHGRMRAVMGPGRYHFIAVPQWLGSRDISDEYENGIGPPETILDSGETVDLKFTLKQKASASTKESKPSADAAAGKEKEAADR